MFPQSTQTWQTAVANVNAYSQGQFGVNNCVGFEMCFARALLNMSISSKVGFVPAAVGGTNLRYNWIPESELGQMFLLEDLSSGG